MGEGVIVRRGGPGGGDNLSNFVSIVIIENTQWKVPKARGQKFSVRIFGGGGGRTRSASTGGGSGGGYMNNSILTLSEGSIIPINIGLGGGANYYDNNSTNDGGTTFFGSYLSAAGGAASIGPDGGSGGTGG